MIGPCDGSVYIFTHRPKSHTDPYQRKNVFFDLDECIKSLSVLFKAIEERFYSSHMS